MELKEKKGDFGYAQSLKHLPENLRNPNGADRCLSGADRCLSGAEGSGYKQTEIGVIPEDWQVKTLGDIGEIKMCRRIFSYQTLEYGEIPFYKIGTFGKNPDAFISRELFDEYKSKFSFPKKGEVLISASGTIGRTVVYEGNDEYFQDSNIIWIANNEHLLTNQMLLFILDVVKFDTEGNTIQRLYNSNIKQTIFICPPLPEQQKIAEALSDTDALIQSLKKLIAKKKDIKQGAMQELLSGKRRLEGFDGEWKEKKLGEICFIKTGSKNNQDKSEDGEYPFFVRSQFVERINSYSYDCEAVLIPGEGGIGSIFHYINGKFDVHQRVYVINEFKEGISAKFIYLYMKEYFGEHALKNTVKATVDSLRLPTFQDFKLIFPKSKKEQTAIAQILYDMDAEIEALEKQLQKTELLKQGMMQELLTGRIRLIKPQAEKLEMVAESKQNYKTHRP